MTVNNIKKYLRESEATILGHLDQTRCNQRSTKRHINSMPHPDLQENLAINHTFIATETINRIYTDQTGRFPVQSYSGNNYIMIIYAYSVNAILAEPIKNRSESELVRAYKNAFEYLTQKGFAPTSHWIDNEAPEGMKLFDRKYGVEMQLTPPYVHRRNAAERAIRTFKNHLIAGLASTHEIFPLYLWDTLLPQAHLTLNLMRPFRGNNAISAYEALEGPYDFDRTPIAIPGARVG